jgi:hypothetical protein
MRWPARLSIYAPHPFEQIIEIPEWSLKKLDSLPMLVSFEPDWVSNPQHRQAYFLGKGLDGGWYIIGGWECLEEAECQKQANQGVL